MIIKTVENITPIIWIIYRKEAINSNSPVANENAIIAVFTHFIVLSWDPLAIENLINDNNHIYIY